MHTFKYSVRELTNRVRLSPPTNKAPPSLAMAIRALTRRSFPLAAFKSVGARPFLLVLGSRGKYWSKTFRTTATEMDRENGGGEAPDSGKIEVNGVPIYYEKYGSGVHPILCMPGALGSTCTDFPPQMEYFGRQGGHYTVVGYDPRGYGKSRPPSRQFTTNPLIYETDAHDAVGVMRSLGFDKFSLLGWSDGGVSAIIAAANYPQHITKLVVWGANAYVSEDDVRLVQAVRDISKWSPRMREPMERLYGEDFPTLWSAWTDSFIGLYDDKERKGDLCIQEVKKVQCPSLVVHGLKDALCPLFHAEYLARELHDSSYVTFPEGKHNVHLKYASEFNKLVDDFLRK